MGSCALELETSERNAGASATRMTWFLGMERRYCLLLILPGLLFLFIIFLSSDLQQWLPSSSSSSPSSSMLLRSEQQHMLEAELRSIALLQRQADELLRLYNAASVSNSSDGETFKAGLLAQLRLNKDAEYTLLSSHSHKNGSLSVSPFLPPHQCQTLIVHNASAMKTIPWKPKPNHYLLAICTSGQFSNHIICIEKHMFLAALLHRTLVLPHPTVDYHYERVLNISHMQNCLGHNNTVITFEDFSLRLRGNLHGMRFLCYMHDCYMDKEHEDALKEVGLSWSKKEDAWPERANVSTVFHVTAAEFVSKFACDDEVLGIGDVFYASMEEEWLKQTGGPLSHTCQSILRPHNFILETAERFIQTFLGKNFVALHFRRYGFLTFCNENSKKGQNCFFYPIPQAAECILRKVSFSSAPVIYLSTDAQESEINLLQSLLVNNGVHVPLVQRPKHDKGEKWDSPLSRHGVLGDKEVMAMLDKTICAMATLFIGTPGSTFTDDILRMRHEWGSASTCDEYLCQGEVPNFIANVY